jgi:uncharacterized protein (TIGR03067 family)
MKTLLAAFNSFAFTFTLFAAEPEAGFKSIFNGKDLTGWEGNTSLWSVRDDAITGVTQPSKDDPKKSPLTHNTFLIWKGGDVADFELRLQYRIVAGNSGIQYRSKTLPAGQFGPIVGGYQADFEAGKTYSGILYEERGRGILAQRGQKTVVKAGSGKAQVTVTSSLGKSEDIQAKIKHEDWNDYVVIAKGNHLQHFINGQQTVDVTDEDAAKAARSGILAFQIHAGPPMTVQFRHVRIQHLKSALADLDRMQGEWKVAELVGNGNPADAETIAAMRLRVTGQTYSVTTADGEDQGKFDLNEKATPREVDVVNQAGTRLRGIYEFVNGRMRSCYASNDAPRPTDFSANEGSNRILIVYERR